MYRYRKEKLRVNHFWDIKGKEKDDVILSVNDTRILREKELREKELRVLPNIWCLFLIFFFL